MKAEQATAFRERQRACRRCKKWFDIENIYELICIT